MNFRCLVLDHDDTAVDSTPAIHYPAHVEMMKRLRPADEVVNLETWFMRNFDPGIMEFLTSELALSPEEMTEEYRIWQEYNDNRTPPFFDGLPELLEDFRSFGGLIAVVSHSTAGHIRRHYEEGAPRAVPDLIYGWDHEPEYRKPSPWPLKEIMRITGLAPEDILMVDDLKPGVEMARAAGIRAAAAGWSHRIPVIRNAMTEICDWWLPDIEALRTLILGRASNRSAAGS